LAGSASLHILANYNLPLNRALGLKKELNKMIGISPIQLLFIIIVFGGFMASISLYLGRRKTETPILVSVIGFFTAFIPPIALIYLIILVFKRDLPKA
jgi:hypothetical protein